SFPLETRPSTATESATGSAFHACTNGESPAPTSVIIPFAASLLQNAVASPHAPQPPSPHICEATTQSVTLPCVVEIVQSRRPSAGQPLFVGVPCGGVVAVPVAVGP